jgi:two-component sensor histidine kinase
MGEVSHRAKNMIAVVQALVYRTADAKYAETLNQRLLALARNQDLLTRRNWDGARLGDLVSSQLATVSDILGSRIEIAGELDVVLIPSAAETIGLAIHELSTNATKYGALSKSGGKVKIVSRIDPVQGTLTLTWSESGGPAVIAPSNKGFGSVMIERNPRLAMGADVEIDYAPSGFQWRLSVPLKRVQVTRSGPVQSG